MRECISKGLKFFHPRWKQNMGDGNCMILHALLPTVLSSALPTEIPPGCQEIMHKGQKKAVCKHDFRNSHFIWKISFDEQNLISACEVTEYLKTSPISYKVCLFLVRMTFPLLSISSPTHRLMSCTHQDIFCPVQIGEQSVEHSLQCLADMLRFSVSFLLLRAIALWYNQTLGSGKLPWITLQLCSLCY